MYELYYWPTPNGWKVTIFFEETGLPYSIVPVDIRAGDQFKPDFLAFSPNNKMPALRDPDGPGGKPHTVFESAAILMYLAEKSGHFWPADMAQRYDVISWLFFQMASLGPMFGQYGHFTSYAKDKNQTYAIERFTNERYRIYCVLERRLGQVPYLAGADYSLADMATLPWVLPDRHGIDLAEFPNVARWHKELHDRPAVQRGLAAGKALTENAKPLTEEQKSILYGQAQFQKR